MKAKIKIILVALFGNFALFRQLYGGEWKQVTVPQDGLTPPHVEWWPAVSAPAVQGDQASALLIRCQDYIRTMEEKLSAWSWTKIKAQWHPNTVIGVSLHDEIAKHLDAQEASEAPKV